VRRHNRGLVIIAIFKVCSAILLFVVGFGLLKLLHRDIGEAIGNFLRSLRVDPDNEFLGWILAKLSLIDDPKKIATFSAASFGYGALLLVQGIGLYFEKKWAEYLTIIATASFLPLEAYELVTKFDVVRISLLLINLAIVWFLVITIRDSSVQKRRR
jgi:uncharacterized membrane protein (DUF2068 family)